MFPYLVGKGGVSPSWWAVCDICQAEDHLWQITAVVDISTPLVRFDLVCHFCVRWFFIGMEKTGWKLHICLLKWRFKIRWKWKKTINLALQWSCLGPWLVSNWVAAAWRANLSFLLPNFKISDVDNGGEDTDGVDVCGCQDFFWMNQTVCININVVYVLCTYIHGRKVSNDSQCRYGSPINFVLCVWTCRTFCETLDSVV